MNGVGMRPVQTDRQTDGQQIDKKKKTFIYIYWYR